MAGSIARTVSLIVLAAAATWAPPSVRADGGSGVVVLYDSSASMLPWHDAAVAYLASSVLPSRLRSGDAVTVLSFDEDVEVEYEGRVRGEPDARTLAASLMLIRPYGRYTDLPAAMAAGLAAVERDGSRRGTVIVVTDGVHSPPPGSASATLDRDGVRDALAEAASAIRARGWEVLFVPVPAGSNASVSGDIEPSLDAGPAASPGGGPAATPAGGSAAATGAGAAVGGTAVSPAGGASAPSGSGAAAGGTTATPAGGATGGTEPTPGGTTYPSEPLSDTPGTGAYGDVLSTVQGTPAEAGDAGTSDPSPGEAGIAAGPSSGTAAPGSTPAGAAGQAGTVGDAAPSAATGTDRSAGGATGRALGMALLAALALVVIVVAVVRIVRNRGYRSRATPRTSLNTSAGDDIAELRDAKLSEARARVAAANVAFRGNPATTARPAAPSGRLDARTGTAVDGHAADAGGPGAIRPDAAAMEYQGRIQKEGAACFELRVEGQNTRIGDRNVHVLGAGQRKTLGGGTSDFLIFLLPVPRRIADVYYDGEDLTLVPIKPEFLPGIDAPVERCLGERIMVRSSYGTMMGIRLTRHFSRTELLNRSLHSIDGTKASIDIDGDGIPDFWM